MCALRKSCWVLLLAVFVLGAFAPVSVEGAEAGTQILASQVELPSGVTLLSDPELLVINITQAISAEALEAELESAEADAGIEKDESGEDAESTEAAESDAQGGSEEE